LIRYLFTTVPTLPLLVTSRNKVPKTRVYVACVIYQKTDSKTTDRSRQPMVTCHVYAPPSCVYRPHTASVEYA